MKMYCAGAAPVWLEQELLQRGGSGSTDWKYNRIGQLLNLIQYFTEL